MLTNFSTNFEMSGPAKPTAEIVESITSNKDCVSYMVRVDDSTIRAVPLKDIYSIIKNGDYDVGEAVAELRQMIKWGDAPKTALQKHKTASLPVFCAPVFKGVRKNECMVESSYMIFDADHVQDAPALRGKFADDPNCALSFISPSGDGVKAVYRIETVKTEANYKAVYKTLRKSIESQYSIELDNTEDPARACYLSHDPEARFNPDAMAAMVAVEEIDTATSTAPALTLNCEIDVEKAKSALEHIAVHEPRPGRERWMRLSWALFAAVGQDLRTARCMLCDVWPEETPNEYDKLLKSYKDKAGGVHAGTLYHEARQLGWSWKDEPKATQEDPEQARQDWNKELDAAIHQDWLGLAVWLGRNVLHDSYCYNFTSKQWDTFQAGKWVVDTERSIDVVVRDELLAALTPRYFDLVKIAKEEASKTDKPGEWKKSPTGQLSELYHKKLSSLRNAAGIYEIEKVLMQLKEYKTNELAYDKDMLSINTGNAYMNMTSNSAADLSGDQRKCKKQMAVEYKAGADCPEWKRGLEKALEGDSGKIGYLQRLFGSMLEGTPSEHLPILYGSGCNGKSIITLTIQRLMGDYAVTMDPEIILGNPRHGQNIDYARARLHGVRMVVLSETEKNEKLSAATLKKFASIDEIYARRPGENPFSFSPTHKLIMLTNNRPIIDDVDEGTWRRLSFIRFGHNFRNDPDKRNPDDLLRMYHAEGPGILNWMLEGYRQYKVGGLQPPESVRYDTEEYHDEADDVRAWLKENYVDDEQGFVKGSELHDQFILNGPRKIDLFASQKKFYDAIETRGYKKVKKMTGVSFAGLTRKT